MNHPFLSKIAVLFGFVGGAVVFQATPLEAALLDWNTTGAWTAGTPTTTAVNQNFTSTGGLVNVSIVDSSAGTVWQTGSNGVSTVASPGVNHTLLTDHLTNQNALQLSIFSQPTTAAFVKVTVTFATPATNVNFTLWDVDQAIANQQGNTTGNVYTDRITAIQGVLANGTTINPLASNVVNGGSDGVDNATTTVAGAVTVNGTQVTGGSANGGTENDALNSGQVSISFGNAVIKSFTFEWLNPNAGGASTQQFIALGNINFTPVPEIRPGLAAVVLCGGMVAFGIVRQRRKPSQTASA